MATMSANHAPDGATAPEPVATEPVPATPAPGAPMPEPVVEASETVAMDVDSTSTTSGKGQVVDTIRAGVSKVLDAGARLGSLAWFYRRTIVLIFLAIVFLVLLIFVVCVLRSVAVTEAWRERKTGGITFGQFMQVFWEEAGRQVQAFRTRVANAWREWREDVAARRRKRELARKAARERRQLAMRLKGATNVSDADSLRSALESGRDVVMGGQTIELGGLTKPIRVSKALIGHGTLVVTPPTEREQRKQWRKTFPVPCIVFEGEVETTSMAMEGWLTAEVAKGSSLRMVDSEIRISNGVLRAAHGSKLTLERCVATGPAKPVERKAPKHMIEVESKGLVTNTDLFRTGIRVLNGGDLHMSFGKIEGAFMSGILLDRIKVNKQLTPPATATFHRVAFSKNKMAGIMMKDGCSVDMNECSISMSAMGILGAKGCKVDLKEVSFTSCMARAISLVGKESKLTMMQRCSIKGSKVGVFLQNGPNAEITDGTVIADSRGRMRAYLVRAIGLGTRLTVDKGPEGPVLFSKGAGNGIAIEKGAAAKITGCRVENCGKGIVVAKKSAVAKVTDINIIGCKTGVAAQWTCNAVVERCNILKSETGLSCNGGNCQLDVLNCKVQGFKQAGLKVGLKASLRAEDTDVLIGAKHGILVGMGQASFRRVDVSSCEGAGILITFKGHVKESEFEEVSLRSCKVRLAYALSAKKTMYTTNWRDGQAAKEEKDEEQPAEEKPEDGSAEAEDEEEEMEEEDEDEDGKKKRKKKSKVESAEKETGKEIAEEELEEEIDELKGQAMDVAANKAGVDKSSAEEVGDGAGLSPEDLDMSAFLGDETKQTISEFLINAAGKLCFFFCETECGEKVLEQITCCCSFTPPIGQIMKYSMKYAKKKKKEIEDKDMDRLWEQHQKLAPRVLTTKRVVAKKADVPAA